MAFANVVRMRRVNFNGECEESGTWALSGGSTTGNIVPELVGHGVPGGIREIFDADAESDTDSAALVKNLQPAGITPRSVLKITSAANDTGTYTIIGRTA